MRDGLIDRRREMGRAIPFLRAIALAALILTIGGAPAQAQDACSQASATCGAGVQPECLLKLGAGTISAGGGEDDGCAAQIEEYRACLSNLVQTCGGGESRRGAREELTAIGMGWDAESYLGAAAAQDVDALALYHEAGFLNRPAQACKVLLGLIEGRVPGPAQTVIDAFASGFLDAPPCDGVLVDALERARRRVERSDFDAQGSLIVTLTLSECLDYDLRLRKGCKTTTAHRALVSRDALAEAVAPRIEKLKRTLALLENERKRVEICVAFFVGDARIDPDAYDVALAGSTLGLGDSVFGSTRDLVSYRMRSGESDSLRGFCERGYLKGGYERAQGNVIQALKGLDQFVSLGE